MTHSLLGAITFDPTIRGILVVLVGFSVLMGSVYLLLATNAGVRNGFLIAGAGLLGWCFLMGLLWWMYGIGLKGRDPAWTGLEINYERSAPLRTPLARTPPKVDDLPAATDVMAKAPLLSAVAASNEGPDFEPDSLGAVVGVANSAAVFGLADAEKVAHTVLDDKKYSEFLAARPGLAAQLREPTPDLAANIRTEARKVRDGIEDRLNGWCLLAESDQRRGEAVASSDSVLASEKVFGENTAPSDYIVGDVFFYGGKDGCVPLAERGALSQAWHRIATTFEVKNPALYSIVTLVKTKPQVTVEGQAPPPPKAQSGVSTISVIMERNLGNRRWPPFVFTVACGLLFTLFILQLNHRDRMAKANIAAAGS